jgi:hypothetical protein
MRWFESSRPCHLRKNANFARSWRFFMPAIYRA